MRARFFGHFEVLFRYEVVDLGRNRKAISLFKRLLAHRPHPVSQDLLMGWLWPESSPRKARWSLNSAVRTLRKTLVESTGCEEFSGFVRFDAGRYRLSPEVRVSSDVREFDACYERGRLLEKSGRPDEAVREYEGAAALYRGDYLVDDIYEDWTMIERERLSGADVDVLDRLVRHYMDSGRLHNSIGLCYRVLEKDPYHEESYRRLMRCYSRLGLRNLAVRQYELCQRAFASLYGTAPSVTPSEETRSLHERLLRGGEVW